MWKLKIWSQNLDRMKEAWCTRYTQPMLRHVPAVNLQKTAISTYMEINEWVRNIIITVISDSLNHAQCRWLDNFSFTESSDNKECKGKATRQKQECGHKRYSHCQWLQLHYDSLIKLIWSFSQLDKRTTIDIYSGCPTAKWTWNSQADNR